MKTMRKLFNSRGTSTLEFVVVLPVLLFVLFSIVELSRAWLTSTWPPPPRAKECARVVAAPDSREHGGRCQDQRDPRRRSAGRAASPARRLLCAGPGRVRRRSRFSSRPCVPLILPAMFGNHEHHPDRIHAVRIGSCSHESSTRDGAGVRRNSGGSSPASSSIRSFASLALAGGPEAKETVVVAAVNMSMAEAVTSQHVKLVQWPKGAIPAGAIRTLPEAEGRGAERHRGGRALLGVQAGPRAGGPRRRHGDAGPRRAARRLDQGGRRDSRERVHPSH